ncbi:hypothetical protein ONZ51_g7050 [Trametes cubensis]|uniref:C2 domain-containing protein n=1 Tax=Trametes cubensis TaxID=1111947 RepID=A0AAD7XAJ7_9APHY|nr:hypothetical protein ONZ51_g7050 [Trametes cubensis]
MCGLKTMTSYFALAKLAGHKYYLVAASTSHWSMQMTVSKAAHYTCEIVFHSAANVPLADLNDLSSDPYIAATLIPNEPGTSGPDLKAPQSTSYRTPTARRSLNPTFNARWIVAGIPASGFVLSLSLRDEDPGDHDDKLGKAVIRFPDPHRDTGEGAQELKESWDSGEREYKVHKRHGSLRTRLGTVRVLGPAPHVEGEDAGRVYTLGPHVFVRHFSPLATHLTSVKSFIANRLQLTGPVPAALRHRYVGFAPFVKAMFRARGIEGILLNRALHKQHRAIYKWDRNTIWGVVGEEDVEDQASKEAQHKTENGTARSSRPDEAFARKFLEMTAYGTEGRIFTYVIMLDGEWRFTETGEEFAIQLLSKHTMHADVAVEIAYSGEFFVRRINSSKDASSRPANGECSQAQEPDGNEYVDEAEGQDDHPRDPSSLPPSAYELVIDNDSGTYRPHKDLLPTLAAYLSRPENLGALGRVRAMDGFDERLKRWKEHRQEVKKRARGGDKAKGVVRQASVSSSSSSGSSSSRSDVEQRDAVEGARQDAETERRSLEERHEQEALEDDGQRAKENGDYDQAAREEEKDLPEVKG